MRRDHAYRRRSAILNLWVSVVGMVSCVALALLFPSTGDVAAVSGVSVAPQIAAHSVMRTLPLDYRSLGID